MINDSIVILSRVLNKLVSFDDEQEKQDFILDIVDEFKNELKTKGND